MKPADRETILPDHEMNLALLCDEYRTFAAECGLGHGEEDEVRQERLIHKLISAGDWTHTSARLLMNLVNEHGSFVLRNAAALAMALGIEDGSDGR